MAEGEQIAQLARRYRDELRWSVIPIVSGTKRPAIRWRRFQATRASDATLDRWFGQPRHEIAVVLGPVSDGLACRDFDQPESYHRWASAFPQLASDLPTVATSGDRRHVYFRAVGLPIEGIHHLGDGELRLSLGYCLLPPSHHPSGCRYAWKTQPITRERPTIPQFRGADDLSASGLATSWGNATERTESTELTERTEKTEEDSSNESQTNISRQTAPRFEDLPPQLQEAIRSTLPHQSGQRHKQVFELARALKAAPGLADAPGKAMLPYVQMWHEHAKKVATTQDFTETWCDFLNGWDRVKFPRGKSPFEQALALAKAVPPPPEIEHLDHPQARLLASVCRELQRTQGETPFYLSCRKAAELISDDQHTVDHKTANRWLTMLTKEELLHIAEIGQQGGKRATRYRYRGSM